MIEQSILFSNYFQIIVTSLFGLVIGSFLNVIILRYGKKMSFGGRSFCPSCKYQLRFFDLMPVFSFLFLRAKCRKCKKKISWQYPLVELATSLTFVLVYIKIAILSDSGILALNLLLLIEFAYQIVVWSILIVIFVYDYHHKIIPDGLSFGFAGLSLLYLILNSLNNGFNSGEIWSLLAGPLIFLPFYVLWLYSKGRWIGLGDGKLALGIGWYLGLSSGGAAIILGFWIGAIVSLFIIAVARIFNSLRHLRKRITIKSEIPFGPYLIIGMFVAYFYDLDFVSLSDMFSVFTEWII